MKTVFVTLLMIGIAMGQITGSPTKGAVTIQPVCHDGSGKLMADCGRCLTDAPCTIDVPAKPKPVKPPANKAAPITELMGAPKCKIVPAGDGCNACTVCDGPNSASMCTTMYCTQKGELEKLLKSPPVETRSTLPGDGGGIGDLLEWKPLDVPAIRKTRKHHLCAWSFDHMDCENAGTRDESYWSCKDPDAYSLQISVSGKAANCHRIAP